MIGIVPESCRFVPSCRGHDNCFTGAVEDDGMRICVVVVALTVGFSPSVHAVNFFKGAGRIIKKGYDANKRRVTNGRMKTRGWELRMARGLLGLHEAPKTKKLTWSARQALSFVGAKANSLSRRIEVTGSNGTLSVSPEKAAHLLSLTGKAVAGIKDATTRQVQAAETFYKLMELQGQRKLKRTDKRFLSEKILGFDVKTGDALSQEAKRDFTKQMKRKTYQVVGIWRKIGRADPSNKLTKAEVRLLGNLGITVRSDFSVRLQGGAIKLTPEAGRSYLLMAKGLAWGLNKPKKVVDRLTEAHAFANAGNSAKALEVLEQTLGLDVGGMPTPSNASAMDQLITIMAHGTVPRKSTDLNQGDSYL